MSRLAVVALLLSPAVALQAPAAQPLRAEEKGTYVGILFAPVPEVLYDQLPNLPRGQGVLVTHVLPDSPASEADVRRHDLLVRYGDTKVRDCEHLVTLIREDRIGRKVKLSLLRAGTEKAVDVTLVEGPVLRVASNATADPPKVKTTAPAVSVAATPLEGGKMKVTIAYYRADNGQLRTFSCQGDRDEIDGEVKKLPSRERDLVRAALSRIRELNVKK